MILFTDKKITPAVLKSLSKKYLGKLVFGEIRNDEATLLKVYGVSRFPTIVALTDIDNFATSEKYTGEFKVD